MLEESLVTLDMSEILNPRASLSMGSLMDRSARDASSSTASPSLLRKERTGSAAIQWICGKRGAKALICLAIATLRRA
jgi:hypothetical protein